MQLRSLQQVSVWLDDLSTDDGAFREAMEWSSRLGLPLRAVVTSARFGSQAPSQESPASAHGSGERKPSPLVERIAAWGNACAQRGIAMESSFWVGDTDIGIDQFLRPWGLCVLEENRSDPVRARALARSLHDPGVLLLLAPPTYQPMSRVLIVCHDQQPNPTFLESAARLCLVLDVPCLFLTVASSERRARRQQSFAEGVCASLHLQADFDCVAGLDYRAAAKRVAAWRQCSHVIVERPHNVSLWQRLRQDSLWRHWQADVFSELRSLADSVAVLGLPESVALEVPQKTGDNRVGQVHDEPMANVTS